MTALRYGLLAAGRRRRWSLLPAATTATGTALLTVVLAVLPSVRRQAAQFGDPIALGRTTVAISVLVVLVGALEVAIGATRAVGQRRGEIGVLSATGARPRDVLLAVMVEPLSAAGAGGTVGAVVGSAIVAVLAHSGSLHAHVAPGIVVRSALIAVVLALLASLAASLVPVARAVRRPPLISLRRAA